MRLLWLLSLLPLAGCVSPMPVQTSGEMPTEAEALQDSPEVAPAMAAETTSSPSAIGPTASPSRPVPRRRPERETAPPPPLPSDQVMAEPMEEVVVTPESVTGFWRLNASHNIDVDIGLFSGVRIRYGGDLRDRNICWLQQNGRALKAVCSSGAALKSAEGSVDDDKVTMRWWAGPATIIFSGKRTEANRIVGGFGGGVIGLQVTGDVPASLARVEMPTQPSERPAAAMLPLVWQDVRQGRLTEGRYDGNAAKRVTEGLSAEIAKDPPVQLLFLGEILIRWRKEQRELTEDVYQVSTAGGRQLCRIALTPAGLVDDLNCQTLPR